MTLEIKVTSSFQREQGALGPRLQGLLSGVVRDFVRLYESDPRTVTHHYDQVEVGPVATGRILELELTSKDRVLAHWLPGSLTLVSVGGHETPSRFRRRLSSLGGQLAKALPAPAGYWPDHGATGHFFGNATAADWVVYARENDPDWLYYLADDQRAVVARVRKAFDRASQLNQARLLVMGGPGTGKTSVLLSLLHSMTREGHRVGIVLSDAVARQATLSDFHVEPFRRRGAYEDLDLLLVDDPAHKSHIEDTFNRSYGAPRTVVVAFDPAQMEEDFTDEDLERIQRRVGVTIQRLRDSYRQKEVVGAAAKRVVDRVAESSPFVNPQKVRDYRSAHRHVFEIANDMRFVNAGGAEQVFRDAQPEDARKAIRDVRTRPCWRLTSPPLLLVVDGATEVDWAWDKWLRGIPFERIALTGLSSIKGLEYQWVMIVIGQRLYSELEHGFEGSSRRVYEARRLLRIPFSRARDAIYTFVVPDPKRASGWDSFAVADKW